MLLTSLGFPISISSFQSFLVATVPNADGFCSTDTGYNVIEKIPFVQADIDNINNYYNSLTASGEAAKIAPTQTQLVSISINQAIQFSSSLMLEFASENVLLGITQSGQSGAVIDYLHDLIHSFLSGSLYEAIVQIDGYIADTSTAKTNLATFINNDRLQIYKNKIQTYLNIPLT